MRQPTLLLVAGAAFILAAPSFATERSASAPAPSVRASAWQAFRARHGGWSELARESASSRPLAVGPAILLPEFRDDAEGVDRSLRRFVAQNDDLFGTPSLERTRATRAGNVWYVSYRRTIDGVPVLDDDWEFRVGIGGTLMAFSARPAPAPPQTARARLSPISLEARARAALALDASAEVHARAAGWLPLETAEGVTYRLVVPVDARAHTTPAAWGLYLDAGTGEVLWQLDRVRHLVTGQVTGNVHLGSPYGPTSARPMPHLTVAGGADVVQTDASGDYALPTSGSVTVTSGFHGAFCTVQRSDDTPDASFSKTIDAPGVVDIAWTDLNSQAAERDVYYHLNLVYDWIHAMDPAFTALDFALPCAVNFAGSCNAIWDGIGITFYNVGAGCPNAATMPDVIYHEYGHAMCDKFYVQLGQSFGMLNGALHEGLADALSCFLRDDPVVGRDFFAPGSSLRTLETHKTWPKDRDPQPDHAGLILGGALWDLRKSLGLSLASRLAHFALYGKPDSGNDGDAMTNFFVELLVADDDDGNLANGTPHDRAIISTFNAHGIGTGHLLRIDQEDPEDHFVPGPYYVFATVTSTSPIGVVAGAALRYSVNGGPYAELPMDALGGDTFSAAIPAPQGSIVRYYVRATDSFGGTRNDPPIELDRTKLFLAGAMTKVVNQEAELPYGWQIGDGDDDAVGGIWEWGEPNGTVVGYAQQCQPESDHSPSGIMCLFTGQARVGESAGSNDVDGGVTTLFSPLLDISAAGANPVVEYWRWFSNDLGGGPVEDHWRTWISPDLGVSWVPIEDTMVSENSWHRVAFLLHDYVGEAPDGITLRFAAEDVGQPSLVEAAVDDVHVWRIDAGTTDAPPATASLALGATPNPFREAARVTFSLPRAGAASLAVLDLQGRHVRTLRSGVLASGPQTITWDGRDEAGTRAPSGLYFLRLETGGETLVRRLARLR